MSYSMYDNVTNTWREVDCGLDRLDQPLYDGDVVFDTTDWTHSTGMWLYTVSWEEANKVRLRHYKDLISLEGRNKGVEGRQDRALVIKVPLEIAKMEPAAILLHLNFVHPDLYVKPLNDE